jgi:hypothetical protein
MATCALARDASSIEAANAFEFRSFHAHAARALKKSAPHFGSDLALCGNLPR